VNRAHKTGDHKSTRLVNKELFDLWKIPTPGGHSISEPFRLEELAALRARKASRIGLHLPGVHNPPLGLLSNLGFATSSLPACASSKFQRSGEEH